MALTGIESYGDGYLSTRQDTLSEYMPSGATWIDTEMASPPYDNMGDLFDDQPRQKWRRLRKRIGLPASADVGVMADLLRELRDKANDFVKERFTTAVITAPHLVALYREDIADALEHIGLCMYRIWLYRHLVYETASAYAGSGLGLCTDYANASHCFDVQEDWPRDIIFPVLYTRTALTMSLAPVKGMYYIWEPSYRYRMDFDLGSDKLLSLETPQEIQDYWSQVRDKLVEVFIDRSGYDKPHKIILQGESASEPDFIRNLWTALAPYMPEDPELFADDPLYVAAKGAAEFAKRAPYTDQWWEISWNRTHNLSAPAIRHQHKEMATGLHT